MTEIGASKSLKKASVAYHDAVLKYQELQKSFVAQSNPAKRQSMKASLIAAHKDMKSAELEFNKAVANEPESDDFDALVDHKINENLDAKYTPDNLYQHAVKSRYIIGFQGREDILYFKSKDEAKKYINQKPDKREYLGVSNKLKEAIKQYIRSAIKEDINKKYSAEKLTKNGMVYIVAYPDLNGIETYEQLDRWERSDKPNRELHFAKDKKEALGILKHFKSLE